MRWETIRRTHEYDLWDGDLYVGSIERVDNRRWEARDADGTDILPTKVEAEDWLIARRADAVLFSHQQEWAKWHEWY